MKKKTIRTLQTLIILIVIGFSVSLMVIPEELNYDHSLKYLKEKENEISSVSTNIRRNNAIIKEELITQKSLEQERKDAKILRDMLNENKYFVDLDIPSMLIFLEQEAYASNIEIDINFYKIVNHEIVKGSNTGDYNFGNKGDILGLGNKRLPDGDIKKLNDREDRENKEDVEDIDYEFKDVDIVENNDRNQIGQENNEEIQSTEVKSEEVSVIQNDVITLLDSVFFEELPDIDGLNVSLVPIAVKGNFSDIGEFIRRLDVVDYLEPAYMGTYSTGEEVISTIALFLFHKEGGM